jgi:hypothetical protein
VDGYYTLVRHSAYEVARDPNFYRAVEERSITEKRAEKVKAKGGLVFSGYLEASEAAEAENYPAGYIGIVPQANGAFLKMTIEGAHVYRPRAKG